MKNKIKNLIPALMFCMGAFFMSATAYAQSTTDTTPPTIRASLSGDILHIEARDDLSGVDAVFIGNQRVNYRVDDAVDVAFQDYAGTEKQAVGVYAVDFAGNQSKTVMIQNPYYKPATAPQTTKPVAATKPVASATADPEVKGPTEPKPFTPSGQATVVDNATSEDDKEFYTFTTPNDNVFYLVIDKQRDSENVYFLNAVTENDLMELAEKGEKKESESAIPEVEVCSCKDKCETGNVNTSCRICKNKLTECTGKTAPALKELEQEKPKQESNTGTMVFIVLAVLAAGGAGYYFKIYKPKHDLDDAEDLDDLLEDGDEPEINEDSDQEYPKTVMMGESEDDGSLQEGQEKEKHRIESENTVLYDDYPDDDPETEQEELPE